MLPFCSYFGGTGKGTKVNLDNLLPDLNAVYDGLDDGSLLLSGEARPAVVEVAGFSQDFVLAEVLDLEEVELALESG